MQMHSYTVSALLLATVLACAGSATAAPMVPFVPDHHPRAFDRLGQHDDAGLILVQGRGRGGGGQRGANRGGGGQRAAVGANRGGGFNSNDFHRNMSNTRNVNVNANRNVAVRGGGGCCYGNYNTGPSWGGVAAGVATGALVGAAVHSAASTPTYYAPPPTYPPGYVTPPPY